MSIVGGVKLLAEGAEMVLPGFTLGFLRGRRAGRSARNIVEAVVQFIVEIVLEVEPQRAIGRAGKAPRFRREDGGPYVFAHGPMVGDIRTGAIAVNRAAVENQPDLKFVRPAHGGDDGLLADGFERHIAGLVVLQSTNADLRVDAAR